MGVSQGPHASFGWLLLRRNSCTGIDIDYSLDDCSPALPHRRVQQLLPPVECDRRQQKMIEATVVLRSIPRDIRQLWTAPRTPLLISRCIPGVQVEKISSKNLVGGAVRGADSRIRCSVYAGPLAAIATLPSASSTARAPA